MGCPQGKTMVCGFVPNGLLPNEASSVNQVLDQGRWSQAEERTAELISHIQPNQPSDAHRKAVESYVRKLIMKCFSCQVFTFGSVPLKTYLPDGDIDLTAFSSNPNIKDSWARKVQDILESEEKSENAEFCVKEVQLIEAEVKIVKCLVENFVVDISFNQLGGLCTLCFLEEVDNVIRRNHIFKRSILLIKAWCYYESRILGASNGLISTYALETLVLYIFHVYNNTFAGPLEVLYRFLVFFSQFDWDNYCLSLWGPVPMDSLSNMRAEPPLKDSRELLLHKSFLNACKVYYGVMPPSQENQEHPFASKYFNIVDPLRANNNLGRSVNKGNFFRIRKAFAFGSQRLVRLLDCPEENLIDELDFFFRNTWDRCGKGHRPDAPSSDLYAKNKTIENFTCHEPEDEHAHASQASHYTHQKYANHFKEAKRMFGTSDVSSVSQTQIPKTNGILIGTVTSDRWHKSFVKNALADEGQILNDLSNEALAVQHSRPEFAHKSAEVKCQNRCIGVLEAEEGQNPLKSKVLDNQNSRVSAENPEQTSYDWRINDFVDSKSASSSYNDEISFSVINKDGYSVDEAVRMPQNGSGFMNITETDRNHNFNGFLKESMNVNTIYVPSPLPPPVLTSGYAHASSVAMLPVNLPPFQSFWGQNMPDSHCLVPFPAPSNQEYIIEPVVDNVVLAHLAQGDSDGGFWSKENMISVGEYDYEDGNIQASLWRDRKTMFSTVSSSSDKSSWLTNSESYLQKDNEPSVEQSWLTRANCSDELLQEKIERDVNSTAGCTPASHSTSTSEPYTCAFSSESPSNASKLNMDQRVLKLAHPIAPSAVYERQHEGKQVDHISAQQDDDSGSTYFAGCKNAETVTLDVQTHQSDSSRQELITVSNSNVPDIPVLVCPGSNQRTIGNLGLVPFVFHPNGTPVPAPTMFPFCNIPPKTGTPYTTTSCMNKDAESCNLYAHPSNVSLGSTERCKNSNTFHKSNYFANNASSEESFLEPRYDILHGDFINYWLNLQYGRFCLEDAQLQGPLCYSRPIYVQEHFQKDGRGRHSANMNIMAPGPPPLVPMMPVQCGSDHLVPMMPVQCGSDHHVRINQVYADGHHRYSGGTGTYLPNPRYYKRHSDSRHQRENYNYDRNDLPGERDGNMNFNSKPRWERDRNMNFNSKPRFVSRGQFHYQVEGPGTRTDKSDLSNRRPDSHKPWNSFKHGSISEGNSYSGSFTTSRNSNHVAAANMPHGIHSPPVSAKHFSFTREATHPSEGSHNSISGLAKFERESAESYPN